MKDEPTHIYPKDGDHFWSEWHHKTGIGPGITPTQYRTCLVHGCKAVETRNTPR